MLSDEPHEPPSSQHVGMHAHNCQLSSAVFKLLIVCLADIKCRATGEYVVSFEVWHEKLIKDAERYYEQKQEEYG